MTTKYQRPTDGYEGQVSLANRTKYQNDAAAVPKVAISSTKIDGDFNYILDALNEIDGASGARASIADRLGVSLNEDGTLKVSVASALDDWIDQSASNITRVDNSTIRIDGDHTGVFNPNRRVRLVVNGANVYASVAQSSFNAGETSIELVDLTDNFGSAAIIDAAPSVVSYGPVSGGEKGNLPTSVQVQKIRAEAPLVRIKDTTASGKEFALRSKAGVLEFLENTGTENAPIWAVRGSLDNSGLSGLNLLDDSVSLAKLAHGTAGKLVGFDENGAPAELEAGISDEAVTTAKLADGAVTLAKLDAGALPAASTTTAGKVELATLTEVKTGTDSTRAISPSVMKNAIGFSKFFESSEVTITPNSANAANHGLGSMPKLFTVAIRCKVAELGYAVGDEVTDINTRINGGVNSEFGSFANATQVGISMSNVITLTRKDNASLSNITNANWKFVFRAWG